MDRIDRQRAGAAAHLDSATTGLRGMRSLGAALAAAGVVLAVSACGGGGSGQHASPPSTTLPSSGPSSTSSVSNPEVTPSSTPTTATPTGGNIPTSTARAPLASCNLPLTHDTDDGFHIAVPAGWELSTINGELEVEKDVSASEAVLVVPAAQTNGITPAGFFAAQMSTLESQAKSEGRTMTVQRSTSGGGNPSVSFSAPINGQTAEGEASVEVVGGGNPRGLPGTGIRRLLGSGTVVRRSARELTSIGRCYGPEPGSLYRVFRDQAFTYIMPPGWTVGDESQNNIDLHDGSADVSYDFAETVPSSEVDPRRP